MPTRLRPFLASVSFLALAALCARHVRGHEHWNWFDAMLVGLPVLAALGAHARSLGVHVAIRALAWLHIVLGLASTFLFAAVGPAIASALGAAAIVALGRDSYEERAARSGFAPIAFRGAFLGASTAAAALAMILGLVAVLMIDGDAHGEAACALAFAAGLVGAAALVLRMRALGVLLALATAALAATAGGVCALGEGDSAHFAAVLWMITALGGLAFAAPVAWSRLRPIAPSGGPRRHLPITASLAVVLAVIAALGSTTRTPFFWD